MRRPRGKMGHEDYLWGGGDHVHAQAKFISRYFGHWAIFFYIQHRVGHLPRVYEEVRRTPPKRHVRVCMLGAHAARARAQAGVLARFPVHAQALVHARTLVHVRTCAPLAAGVCRGCRCTRPLAAAGWTSRARTSERTLSSECPCRGGHGHSVLMYNDCRRSGGLSCAHFAPVGLAGAQVSPLPARLDRLRRAHLRIG